MQLCRRRLAPPRLRRGFTLIELVVVLAIAAILGLVTAPLMSEYLDNQAVKGAARDAADLFSLARAEAIRTGNNHVVFFNTVDGQDEGGNALVDSAGNTAPMLLLNDGAPTASNCVIENGEPFETIPPANGVLFELRHATAKHADDTGAETSMSTITSSGSSFKVGTAATDWVLFRPDGMPVLGTGGASTCGTLGTAGTGGGALYITHQTSERDHAIVLTALGGVRVHTWDRNNDAWSQ